MTESCNLSGSAKYMQIDSLQPEQSLHSSTMSAHLLTHFNYCHQSRSFIPFLATKHFQRAEYIHFKILG